MLNVNAVVWQDWRGHSQGTWRKDPEISGGGFLFDTGAHMLNTVCRPRGRGRHGGRGLAGARRRAGRRPGRGHGAARVGRADHDERVRPGDPVDRVGHPRVLRAGHAADRDLGRAAGAPACRRGRRSARCARSAPKSVWHQFLDVRAGREPNPSPPEIGLRMARLWDAIRESSAQRRGRRPAGDRGGGGMTIRVTVWNEFRQEHTDAPVAAIYPDGIHGAIADGPARTPATASRSGPRPWTSPSTA